MIETVLALAAALLSEPQGGLLEDIRPLLEGPRFEVSAPVASTLPWQVNANQQRAPSEKIKKLYDEALKVEDVGTQFKQLGKAVEVAEKEKDWYGAGMCLHRMALLNEASNQTESALMVYRNSIEFYDYCGAVKEVQDVFIDAVQSPFGLQKVTDDHPLILAIARKNGFGAESHEMALLFRKLEAAILLFQGDLEGAKGVSSQAIILARSKGEITEEASFKVTLIWAYHGLGNKIEVEKEFRSLRAIIYGDNFPVEQRVHFSATAVVLASVTGMNSLIWELGREWMKSPNETAPVIGPYACLVWGMHLFERGRIDESSKFLTMALSRANEIEATDAIYGYIYAIWSLLLSGEVNSAKELNKQLRTLVVDEKDDSKAKLEALGMTIRLATYDLDEDALDLAVREMESAFTAYRLAKPKEHLDGVNELSDAYAFRGEFGKAFDVIHKFFSEGSHECPTCTRVGAFTLANRFIDIGRYEEAIKLLIENIKFYESSDSIFNIASNSRDLAYAYTELGRNEEAEVVYRAMVERLNKPEYVDLWRLAVVNYAKFCNDRGRVAEARQQLDLVKDDILRENSQIHRRNLLEFNGHLLIAEGKYQEAIESFQTAMWTYPVKSPRNMWANFGMARAYANLGDIPLAIAHAKRSVNDVQEVRSLNRGIEAANLQTLLQGYARTFRLLADLLIRDGRISEAEAVIELIQSSANIEYTRSSKSLAEFEAKIALIGREQGWIERWKEIEGRQTKVWVELDSLRRLEKLTEEQEERQKVLTQEADVLRQATAAYLAAVRSDVEEDREKRRQGTDERLAEFQRLTRLDSILGSLEREGIAKSAAYVVVGDALTHIIVASKDRLETRTIEVGREQIAKEVAEFRTALQNPGADVKKSGKVLYDWIAAPAIELADGKPLIWCLDGPLLLVPFGALWDGEKYLIERMPESRFSPLDAESLRAGGKAESSRSFANQVEAQGYSALPGAVREVDLISKVLPGDSSKNEEFTEAVFRKSLNDRKGNVLHIATHFRVSDSIQTSTLLIGKRETPVINVFLQDRELSLAEVNSWGSDLFGHLDLLVLSACDTGSDRMSDQIDGQEVSSFASFAMQSGARSVLASLWEVSDESTASLMAAFYERWAGQRTRKDEALRQTQIDMIEGRLKPGNFDEWMAARSGPERVSAGNTVPIDPAKPWAHPYYWAPFVLTGNFK